MADEINWQEYSLTEIEHDDWGEPTYPSYVVIQCHHLRYKPLQDFTIEDIRLMIGQQISLPILMPMSIDVLETDLLASGEMCDGSLLRVSLAVNSEFWRQHPSLWYRMNVVVGDLRFLQDLMIREILPAATAFEANCPESQL